MSAISYINGDATSPQTPGNRIICHICNDIGGWGKGFVLAISKRWPEPEAGFRDWYAGRDHNDFALGSIQLIQVEPAIWVANMIGQHGIERRGQASSPPPIRYDAVESCLRRLAVSARDLDATVHMPRIGCGLSGGKWEQIEPIIHRTLSQAGIAVFVYDFG